MKIKIVRKANKNLVESISAKIDSWIDGLLREHSENARPALSMPENGIDRYYSANLLERILYVVVDEIPFPPLREMGYDLFQSEPVRGMLLGITFRNTYFVRRGHEAYPALHFHELVHVVQWDHLGYECFLPVYGHEMLTHGYEENILELMAFSLQERFNAGEEFDAEREIRNLLDEMNIQLP